MPPYAPVKSRSQSRALFAKARDGEMSMDDARGKTRAADMSHLPEKVGKKANRKAPRGRMRGGRC